MAKHGISWISLLKSQAWWRFNENPKKTQRFLCDVLSQDFEGKEPPEWDFVFSNYKDLTYTINRNWEVKWLNWQIMTPFFSKNKRWPRVRIQYLLQQNGTMANKEKEVSILSLMNKIFWRYLTWYKRMENSNKHFILVFKDWDPNNIKRDNLEYIDYRLFREIGTKRWEIRNLLTVNASDKYISSRFGVSRSEIQKVKKKMVEEGKLPKYQRVLNLREQLWFELTEELLPIYEALLESLGKLSNDELARILWKEEYSKADVKEKERFKSKISRARKRLTEKWFIPRYNELFEKKKAAAIRMLSEKELTGYTNKDIADKLWLHKTQIDNLAKQIKKSVKD